MATCSSLGRIAIVLVLTIAIPLVAGERSNFELKPIAIFDQHLYEGNLSAPRGVSFDAAHGEVLVADSGNNLVGIFRPDGTPLFAFRVKDPQKVIATPNGELLVLSEQRSRILVFSYRGEPRGELTLPSIGEKPVIGAIAFDGDGLLYVGNNATAEVFVYSKELRLVRRFGSRGAEEGQFQSIAGIAVDDKNIFVVDHQVLAVQVFDKRGNFVAGWGRHELGAEHFSLPEGIALDSRGNVFVVDQLRHEIKMFDREGKFIDRFGGMGSRLGQVSFPTDVATDPEGNVYVVDRGNSRVQAFELITEGPPRK